MQEPETVGERTVPASGIHSAARVIVAGEDLMREFDLIVIGTRTAAAAVVRQCAEAGWSAAIIDNRPYGGTCALRGCDPKKMIRRGPEIIDAARR